VVSGAIALSACGSAQDTLNRNFGVQMKDGARPYAMQAAGFGHGFLEGHMVQWEARLGMLEDDLPPFFDALEKSGWRAELEIVPHPPAGGVKYEWYGVKLVLVPKSGGERIVIPGDEGTRTTDYLRALVPAAKATGIQAEVIRRGHFGIFALVTMGGALNATDDSMREMAFRFLVQKEKLAKNDRSLDQFQAMRTIEDARADVDLALRFVADHHASTSRLRAEVLAITALARRYDVPEARRALMDQIAESRKRANEWRRTHTAPTAADFNVGLKEMKLPTPDNMLAVLDKDGYIAAAVQVAKGAVTGDPSSAIEGIGKLAPPNSSVRIAAEGTAAALRGDVVGTAKAVVALAEKQEDVAPIAARLRAVDQAVAAAKGGVDQAKEIAKTDPKAAAIEQVKPLKKKSR
jgi:hypothetical protein